MTLLRFPALVAVILLGLSADSARAESWGSARVLGPMAPPTKISRPPAPESNLAALGHGASGPLDAESWRTLANEDQDPTAEDALLSLQLTPPSPVGTGKNAAPAATTAYVCVPITSEAAETLPLWIVGEDGLTVWLNGVLVLARDEARPLVEREDCCALQLKPGVNWLLLRLDWIASAQWRLRIDRFVAPTHEEIDRAIRRGVDYLVGEQYPDGTWGRQPGLTALALRALLESQVPRERASVQLAERALLTRPPENTEARAWAALTLSSAIDERSRLRASEALDELVRGQDSDGAWTNGGNARNAKILSLETTSLCLWSIESAARSGFRLKKEMAPRALAGLLEWTAHDPARRSEEELKALGFAEQPHGLASGLASADGLAGLCALTSLLESAATGPRRQHAEALLAARARFEAHLRFDRVPEESDPHEDWIRYMSLLARIGSGLGEERLAGIDWYAAGARRLIDVQGYNGEWWSPRPWVDLLVKPAAVEAATSGTSHSTYLHSSRGSSSRETALALLFLTSRARVRTLEMGLQSDERLTTPRPGTEPALSIAVRDGPRARVRLAAIREDALRAFEGRPIHVQRVEIRARSLRMGSRPDVAHSQAGGVFEKEDFSRWTTDAKLPRGAWKLSVALILAGPEAAELRSPEAEVWIEFDSPPDRLTDDADPGRDLLTTVPTKASASSLAGGSPASDVCDGDLTTLWESAENDKQPWIQVDLERPLMADRILLTQPLPRMSDEGSPAVAVAELSVNGGKPVRVEMPVEVWRKGVLDLGPKIAVRSVRVRILETRNPWEHAGIGLSEIELQRVR